MMGGAGFVRGLLNSLIPCANTTLRNLVPIKKYPLDQLCAKLRNRKKPERFTRSTTTMVQSRLQEEKEGVLEMLLMMLLLKRRRYTTMKCQVKITRQFPVLIARKKAKLVPRKQGIIWSSTAPWIPCQKQNLKSSIGYQGH